MVDIFFKRMVWEKDYYYILVVITMEKLTWTGLCCLRKTFQSNMDNPREW